MHQLLKCLLIKRLGTIESAINFYSALYCNGKDDCIIYYYFLCTLVAIVKLSPTIIHLSSICAALPLQLRLQAILSQLFYSRTDWEYCNTELLIIQTTPFGSAVVSLSQTTVRTLFLLHQCRVIAWLN